MNASEQPAPETASTDLVRYAQQTTRGMTTIRARQTPSRPAGAVKIVVAPGVSTGYQHS